MSRKRTSGRYAFSDAKHCTLFEIGAAICILQGIAESLRKVASDPPHILFKESDFASPSYFASIFTVLHLFAIEREADEETFIGFAKMEWLDIASIAVCGADQGSAKGSIGWPDGTDRLHHTERKTD